jgi:midasin
MSGEKSRSSDRKHEEDEGEMQDDQDLEDVDEHLSTVHLGTSTLNAARSPEQARQLWSHYENQTRELSLSLTEQLRLILAPTLATKMRGDFRSGKRLNIKRIIPYIASQYKRDKIWMRRSVPSKRNYQIMVAVDDSKSMGESGSGQLAFETLALVSKSLSMLEVGEICIVGFGDDVRVAHEFDQPFSSETGVHVFQQFGFQQTKTDVRKLVAESIDLFRDARNKTFGAGADLWQLELIISDGVCEDHDTIRRLVRQAQEERIMLVFVIVDALRGSSIMDMSQATFEPDEGGQMKLRMRRYLDDFPFGYYLVVGDEGATGGTSYRA